MGIRHRSSNRLLLIIAIGAVINGWALSSSAVRDELRLSDDLAFGLWDAAPAIWRRLPS